MPMRIRHKMGKVHKSAPGSPALSPFSSKRKDLPVLQARITRHMRVTLIPCWQASGFHAVSDSSRPEERVLTSPEPAYPLLQKSRNEVGVSLIRFDRKRMEHRSWSSDSPDSVRRCADLSRRWLKATFTPGWTSDPLNCATLRTDRSDISTGPARWTLLVLL